MNKSICFWQGTLGTVNIQFRILQQGQREPFCCLVYRKIPHSGAKRRPSPNIFPSDAETEENIISGSLKKTVRICWKTYWFSKQSKQELEIKNIAGGVFPLYNKYTFHCLRTVVSHRRTDPPFPSSVSAAIFNYYLWGSATVQRSVLLRFL